MGSRGLIFSLLILFTLPCAAQTYPYFPPPGVTYSSNTHQIASSNLQPGGSSGQVQYNAGGTLSGNLDFIFTPSVANPQVTIGDSGGLLTGAPTLFLTNGGTTNGTKVNSDDILLLTSGNSGVPATPEPNFTPNDVSVVTATVDWNFGGNNDASTVGQVGFDHSFRLQGNGDGTGGAGIGKATVTLLTVADAFGTHSMGAGFGCTPLNGSIAAGAGGLGFFPQLGGGTTLPGCFIGSMTQSNGTIQSAVAFAAGGSQQGFYDNKGNWTIGHATASGVINLNADTATDAQALGVPILTGFSATSASLGGGALAAGACASNTTTVTGAATTMVANVTPNTYPGDLAYWRAQVSSTNTVTTYVCAAIAGTPTASTYNIRVIK